jgi:hypothetical protein
MTGRPPRYTAELADRILQELARGRTMKDICAEPGMPCDNAVRQWVADDIDGFAARYSEARATGASLVHYPTRYTAEIAEKHHNRASTIAALRGIPLAGAYVDKGAAATQPWRETGLSHAGTFAERTAENENTIKAATDQYEKDHPIGTHVGKFAIGAGARLPCSARRLSAPRLSASRAMRCCRRS